MLIVIRGNSGSGKSTLAAELQRALGWPTALLGQDHFRRTVYRERHDAGHADGMEHAGLLEAAALHCLTAGHHVVLEGIFRADRYAEMLERIAGAATDARFFAFDLTFEETLRRHAQRPEAAEVDPDRMREWYHAWDPLPFVAERPILPGDDVRTVLGRVLEDR
ncbi:AAA family ATPase [Curtobacterium sp. 22159]|uniref:AAA family ATPase n=1 Tax=Curtobacterium sp. 22159 TaxID=3453882 RepID=UPI003F87EF41